MPFKYCTKRLLIALAISSGVALSGCQSQPAQPTNQISQNEQNLHITAQDLYVVDCLLPGQVRQLGGQFTYVTPRRAIQTNAQDCAKRGGEFVAFDRANYQTALKVWLPAAERGEAEAQNHVGEIYQKGLGSAPDYIQAAAWFEKAAQQGDARAQINLGHLYEKGWGVEKNPAKALNYYRLASGIRNGQLEITSEEVNRLRQQQALENQRLREEVLQLTDQLAITQEALNKREQTLNEQKKNLKRLELQLQNLDQNDMQSRIETEKKLARLQQLIVRQEKEIARYQSSTQNLLTRLGANEIPAGNAMQIDIISPELLTTRGEPSAIVMAHVSDYEVVGKIAHPDQIRSLKINDENALDYLKANGLFQYPLTVAADNTPVKIEAISENGIKSNRQFVISKQPEIRVSSRQTSAQFNQRLSSDIGHYHALVIGNNQYLHQSRLTTAENDAKSVALNLEQQYGYETTVLLNATLDEMVRAFAQFQNTLTKNDNLLIYFAGHGILDSDSDKGYWLPIDAKDGQPETWLANDRITDFIAAMEAHHVLVVADSCYAGTLSGAAIRPLPEDASDQDLLFISRVKARTVLTSGGLQPVLDNTGAQHSVFASALLEILNDNVGLMEGYRIFQNLREIMSRSATAAKLRQAPEYSALQHAGHEGSEYFFLGGARS